MTTFRIPDPYGGWSEMQLRERIRELSLALTDWQLIAANMGTVPAALDQLTDAGRKRVENIMEAYSDEPITNPSQ